MPATSTLDLVAADTRANAAIVALGRTGAVSYLLSAGRGDLLADVAGYLVSGTSPPAP